jgi:hypothetical protein
VHCQTDAVDPQQTFTRSWYAIEVLCRVDPSEFIPRSGEHQHGLVIRESAVQDCLQYVVDHALVILNDWPDVDGSHFTPDLLLQKPQGLSSSALVTVLPARHHAKFGARRARSQARQDCLPV